MKVKTAIRPSNWPPFAPAKQASFFLPKWPKRWSSTITPGTGVSVPGDLSIVVLGSGTRTHTLRLQRVFTSYAIPREEMGRQATSMLSETLASPLALYDRYCCAATSWRANACFPKAQLKEREPDVREYNADILVVGGGLGGVAAALGALRNGRSVLTEAFEWNGGRRPQAPATRRAQLGRTVRNHRQLSRAAHGRAAI
ncbi:FAD-dependent oxidoreductase [Agrobacterium burrii]